MIFSKWELLSALRVPNAAYKTLHLGSVFYAGEKETDKWINQAAEIKRQQRHRVSIVWYCVCVMKSGLVLWVWGQIYGCGSFF